MCVICPKGKGRMKQTFITALFAAVFFLCGCEVTDEEGVAHKSRMEAMGGVSHYRLQDGGAGRETPADTVVFVAAVEFPEGYDWRRDTSYGGVPGRIVVFRDGVRDLTVEAGAGHGASLDPDRHHLAGGHLYTECLSRDGTSIGRDGVELFRYAERELLCGLLVEGDDVYTLGQRTGGGFALRRNGEVMYERERGTVAAHMSDNAAYPTGALYRDSGHMYFCYCLAGDGGNSWYVVEDGKESRVDAPSEGWLDIRVRDGETVTSTVFPSQIIYYFYNDGDSRANVVIKKDGSFRATGPDNSQVSLPGSGQYYFFSFRNAFLLGEHFYLAATGKEKGAAPFLWEDGAVKSLEINGFATAVEVLILP